MKTCGIIDTFYIFRAIKFARIFEKKLGHVDYEVK